MSELFHESQAAAREKVIAEWQAQQAATNQPEPSATPEPSERPVFSDSAVEQAAQQAANAIRDSGGSEHDQREAAIAVAKKLQKEKTGLAGAIGGLEASASSDDNETASLRDEVKALREKLEQRDAPLPDPSTVSDEFYFQHKEEYAGQLGIRNRFKF